MTAAASGTPVWTLRDVRVDDQDALDKVAELHMELLNFGPMAGLGKRFIRDICYAAHMEGNLLEVSLAEIDGQPAGFIAYTPYSIGFHRSGLKEHWFSAGMAAARAVITDPRRIPKLLRALKVLASRRTETSLGEDPMGEVVCVAVRKPYLAPAFMRRSGLRPSETLIRYAGEKLAHRGVNRMRMIVDADNKPVLMLYHLMGAHFEKYEQAGEPRVHVWFDLPEASPESVPPCWSTLASPGEVHDESWRSYWERIADQQAVFRIEAGDYVRRLRDGISPGAGMRVLDFGCGFGHTAAALAPHVASVALWDASSTVRQRARIRVAGIPNTELVDLTSDASSARAGQFDLILAHSVLQYMSTQEIEDWLRRWKSMLRPGGRIVLSDLIQPAAGGVGEILGYLGFAARNGFFLKAFVAGVKEFGSYWSARRARPLTAIAPERMEQLGRQAGMVVRWLPRNLSHRQARRTAVLTAH